MFSLQPSFLAALVIPPRVAGLLRRLGAHQGRLQLHQQQAPEILENLRQVAKIESTESSNRLEGIVAANDKRLRELIAARAEPADRTEGEIAGYRDVLDTIHQNHAQIPFTDRVVLQFHRDLLKYAGNNGGQWEISSNEIRETLPDGTKRVRFEPVAPHLTEDAMRVLHEHFADARRDGTWDPLFLIPFYILDFLCIHPFVDRNGRMARLLSLLALYHQGYDVGRYISLERIIEKTKESYYETLYLSSQGWHEGKHDVWPWTEYFLGTLLAAYSEFEARFDRIGSGRGGATTGWNCSGVSMSVADFHVKAACRGRSEKSPAVIDAPLHPIEKDGARVGRDRRARPPVRPHGWCACKAIAKRKKCSARWRSPSHFILGGSQGGAKPPSPTAAVEWSVRYLPDFRLPDKALDLVDQACAAVRFWTLTPEVLVEEKSCGGTPQSRPAARRSSHVVVGREEIAAAVAARCGIPVGTLTADEGEFNERLAVAAVYDRRKISGEDGAAGGKPATVIDRRYRVRIELDESAVELILREGFSEEYGARNLERVMDRLLGSLVADALLSGKVKAGQAIQVTGVNLLKLNFA